MKRLPAERMLDVLLEEDDAVSQKEIREIASRMVEFHRTARFDEEVQDLGSPEKLRQFAINNFEQTQSMVGDLFPAAFTKPCNSAQSGISTTLPSSLKGVSKRDSSSRGTATCTHGTFA